MSEYGQGLGPRRVFNLSFINLRDAQTPHDLGKRRHGHARQEFRDATQMLSLFPFAFLVRHRATSTACWTLVPHSNELIGRRKCPAIWIGAGSCLLSLVTALIARPVRQIAQLIRCEIITEEEVKRLCIKAREILIEEANVQVVDSPVTVRRCAFEVIYSFSVDGRCYRYAGTFMGNSGI